MSATTGYRGIIGAVLLALAGLVSQTQAHNSSVAIAVEEVKEKKTIRAGTSLRRERWQTFDVTDGLASSTVNRIFQDRKGYLWFLTDGGVSRYDGETFTTFGKEEGLAGGWAWTVLEDRQGDLWFGTSGGVSRYDGKSFTAFTDKDGLPGGVYLILQDLKGHLWFGTSGGVSRYNGECFASFTTREGLGDDQVRALFEDRKGNLWFGTSGGLSRYDGERFVTFTEREGLANSQVSAIWEDKKGQLWFGTNSGASRWDGKRFVNFTTADGLADLVGTLLEDREGNLWFGTGIWRGGGAQYSRGRGGASRFDGKRFTSFAPGDTLATHPVGTLLEDRDGNMWIGTWGGGLIRSDGENLTRFTAQDVLGDNMITSLLEDREGNLWVGTLRGGASRFDASLFTIFTEEMGLGGNELGSMLEDREGNLWFSLKVSISSIKGVISRFDGTRFTIFTGKDSIDDAVFSIANDHAGNLWFGTSRGAMRYDGAQFIRLDNSGRGVFAILEDHQGNLWFKNCCEGGVLGWGGVGDVFWSHGGISRFDGRQLTLFTEEDGLASDAVISMLEGQAGDMWFGTTAGVSVFDGHRFTTFTQRDGLAGNVVYVLLKDHRGDLWCGIDGGVSRYSGSVFTNFTTADGLADNRVFTLLEDSQGNLWCGTDRGVSRFDGQRWTTFTQRDGLIDNAVTTMLEDRQGHLWFGTREGVSCFDGLGFQSLRRRDGLAGNRIVKILQDRRGDIWIVASTGITRYRPCAVPPPVFLTEVRADRGYGPVAQIRLPSSQRSVVFEFQGMSFRTRPGQMAYAYRLEGLDEGWRTTREKRVEYTDLPVGKYVFQVKAVDRDLNYSEVPAEVRVIIHPPYGQIALIGGLGVALAGLVIASGYGIRRRRERDRSRDALVREQQARLLAQEQLNQELEKELQTAHDLQMALMPKEPPRIEGFEITGRCTPANHVGGDLFQYFHQHDRLSISLADVTGHAMEAAIPVVMFSGILKSQMDVGGSVEEIFRRLNRSLHGTLTGRTFVCLAMGELDPSTHRFRFSNSGCPYPYHFKAATGEVVELRMDAYPLGVRPDTTYRGAEVQLEPGDRVVFCSDGIIEAVDEAGEMFGFERTAEVIRRGCGEDLSAEGLLERLMGEVKRFRGETSQGDDQTVVVLKVG